MGAKKRLVISKCDKNVNQDFEYVIESFGNYFVKHYISISTAGLTSIYAFNKDIILRINFQGATNHSQHFIIGERKPDDYLIGVHTNIMNGHQASTVYLHPFDLQNFHITQCF